MTFILSAFILAGFCLLFGALALWGATKSGGVPKTLLLAFSVAYLFISTFSVMAGVGFGIEYTNRADCENVISNTTVSGNVTSYEYKDSCEARSVPETIERLYQAYAYVLYAVVLISVFAVMILGLRAIVFKW